MNDGVKGAKAGERFCHRPQVVFGARIWVCGYAHAEQPPSKFGVTPHSVRFIKDSFQLRHSPDLHLRRI